jgi:pantoate--beta-alanine ligase
MVIRQMARDLAIATEVVACATVREADGLALSSRNVHLTREQRAAAPVLHRALQAAQDRWSRGERFAEALRATMRETLADEPLAQVDYVSAADGTTLRELEWIEGPALLSLAVRFGTTRLIDNEPLGWPAPGGAGADDRAGDASSG